MTNEKQYSFYFNFFLWTEVLLVGLLIPLSGALFALINFNTMTNRRHVFFFYS